MFEMNQLSWLWSTDARLLIWIVAQITLVALATHAIVGMARHTSPAARAVVCLLGLVCMTTLPFVTLLQINAWSWGEWLSPRVEKGSVSAAPLAQLAVEPELGDDASRPLQWWEQTLLVADQLFQSSQPTIQGEAQSSIPATLVNWLPVGILGCIALGSVRLLVGLWLVRRMRRSAVSIDDPDLEGELDQCARQLGVAEGLPIAQCNSIGTAAIVGWKNPLLLLPTTWRTWTVEERRAVLAHELAHVRRGDYLITAVAQSMVAIHFFHPLVHALVARLRLDQELAADGMAATVVGGSQRYVEILAGLALRQPQVRTPGPAQAFLPPRRMFVRRLEMLRTQSSGGRGWSRLYMAAASTAVAMLTLFVSGLKPIDAIAQEAGLGKPTTVAGPVADDALLKLIPPNVIDAVIFIDVAELMKSEPVVQILDASPEIREQIPFDLTKLEKALVMVDPSSDFNRTGPMLLLQFSSGWQLPIKSEDASTNGLQTPAAQFAASIRKLDDRTIVLGGDEAMRNAIGKIPSDDFFRPLLKQHEGKAIRVAGKMDEIRKLMSQPPGGDPTIQMFSPLWEKVSTISLGIEVGDSLDFAGELAATDAKAVADTLIAAKTLANNFLAHALDENGPGGQVDPMEKMLMAAAIGQARKFLESSTIESANGSVKLTARIDSGAYAATALLLPAVQSARVAAQRTQSANNLKQIMLALHNYHDAYGHFPPAVIRDPKTGVERSWRVEILPFLEQSVLYEMYRKDEPWDSEANLKLLTVVPHTYQLPQVGSTETPYLAIVSEDGGLTLTKDGKPPQFSDVTDGTSNTVFVVETQPMVPWTKPVDATDAAAVSRVTIRAGENGFNAAFGDGSVRFISNSIEKGVWDALVTRAGGEVIGVP